MNLTLSVSDEIIEEARRRAETMGTSLNQLICDYLEQFAGPNNWEQAASEFERLSRASQASSEGWKFSREDLHQR